MKSNFKSLVEFAQEIERMNNEKKDYLVDHDKVKVRMTDDKSFVVKIGNDVKYYDINNHCHGQIASKLNIPKKYYDSMAVIPELRSINVNSWLTKTKKTKRFVRTIDDKARAFLSDRFKPIDNGYILEPFMEVLLNNYSNIQVKSQVLTDTKMYLQVVLPEVQRELTVGDYVQSGIILSNSEVGAGAVDVSTVIWRLKCKNGMIGKSVMNKYHAGRRISDDFDSYDIFSEETIKADLYAFKRKLGDILKHALSEAFFSDVVEQLKASIDVPITKPEKTIRNVTKEYNVLTEDDGELILSNMIEEKNFNMWGLANGITSLAHKLENRDKQYEVEKIGYKIATASKKDIERLIA